VCHHLSEAELADASSHTSFPEYGGKKKRSELHWTKMHKKVFSGGDKFPAAKFNAAKKLWRKSQAAKIQAKKFQVMKLDAAKISCTEV